MRLFRSRPGTRRVSSARRAAGATLLIFLAVAAWTLPGAAAQVTETVRILQDGSVSGDPDLDTSQLQNRRMAILKPSAPNREVLIFWKELADLQQGESFVARMEFTVSRCRNTDYNPPDGQSSGCENTPSYNYNPEVHFKLILAEESSTAGVPQKSGTVLSQDQITCTFDKHHCIPYTSAGRTITSTDVPPGGADRYVAVVAWATDPDAKACVNPAPPVDCHVVALDNNNNGQSGGELNVIRNSTTGIPSDLKTDPDPNANQLQVATSDNQNNAYREVIRSITLANTASTLLGDQVGVRAIVAVNSSLNYQTPPLIKSYLVFADSASEVDGRELGYRNGENCDGDCFISKQSVVTTVTSCDVAAGRRFVNLVSVAQRSTGSNQDNVNVKNTGGFLETRRYDSIYGPGPPSCP
jgi:hypothetical protein